jgi:hypothetical protein
VRDRKDLDKKWPKGDYEFEMCEKKKWLLESELENAQELLKQFEVKHQTQRGGKRGRPANSDKGR